MNEQNQKENQAEKLTDFGFSKVKETDKEKQVKAVFDPSCSEIRFNE